MTDNRTKATGTLMFTSEGLRDPQADYSYDQWRHAQMRQMERAYLETLGPAVRPAAA